MVRVRTRRTFDCHNSAILPRLIERFTHSSSYARVFLCELTTFKIGISLQTTNCLVGQEAGLEALLATMFQADSLKTENHELHSELGVTSLHNFLRITISQMINHTHVMVCVSHLHKSQTLKRNVTRSCT